MIALLFLAAAAAPVPVLYSAQSQSEAYRACVAAGYQRRPAPVVEIGRGDCARARSRLLAEVRDHVSFGWAATAKTSGQARRLRAQLRLEAEAQVTGFEGKLQAWFVETGKVPPERRGK
ncbi:MAG TPA: hypothetical protein VF605_00595 [Allosphingosinicella sp.]|jgi:hypothetical protein